MKKLTFTKEERHIIYLVMQAQIEELKKDGLLKIGFCLALDGVLSNEERWDYDCPTEILPELKKYKPKNPLSYWFDRRDYDIRINILNDCIKATA